MDIPAENIGEKEFEEACETISNIRKVYRYASVAAFVASGSCSLLVQAAMQQNNQMKGESIIRAIIHGVLAEVVVQVIFKIKVGADKRKALATIQTYSAEHPTTQTQEILKTFKIKTPRT